MGLRESVVRDVEDVEVGSKHAGGKRACSFVGVQVKMLLQFTVVFIHEGVVEA